MEQRFGFDVTLRDPASGQPVRVKVWGTASGQGGDADPQAAPRISAALSQATHQVMAQALAAQQVAMPTLSMSLAHFTPQIVQAANGRLGAAGIQLHSVQMSCQVPESATAPAVAAAPSPAESAASNFAGNVADAAASSVPDRVNVNVGGYNVGFGEGGVDGDGLADQATEKVKSEIFHYVLVGAILLFVAFICCGSVAYKLIFP